jgi:hypothetical protein
VFAITLVLQVSLHKENPLPLTGVQVLPCVIVQIMYLVLEDYQSATREVSEPDRLFRFLLPGMEFGDGA